MKYKPQCGKMAFHTEQSAWEHVVHFRRKGYAWQEPYLCDCGMYHLTSKHFGGKVPKWVKEQASRQSKRVRNREERKAKTVILPLAEQKKLYNQLNNKPFRWYKPLTWW